MTVMATEPSLTPTQLRALAKIREAGVWFPFNGISAATVRVLERAGLVDVKWSVVANYVYRTRRTHYQRDWTATPSMPEPINPMFRVSVDRPRRYLQSPTGMLHLRAVYGLVQEDGLSACRARCGWESDSVNAIPETVSADARVCRRCVVIEP